MDKNVLCSCLLTSLICIMLYKFLSKKTIEVEKFSNQPIIYTSSGKDLVVE